MASIYPVYFNINTILRGLVSAFGGTSLTTSLTLRRNDTLPCEVYFGTASTTDYRESLTTYGVLQLNLNNNLDYDGYRVISVTSFSTATVSRLIGTTQTGVYTYYTGTLALSGSTLNNLFTPASLSQVTLQAEFSWEDRVDGVTYRTNSQPFKIVVQNDVTG